MIKKALAKAINEQINKELYSAYLYLQMAAYFETKTLPGFANWMKVQAQEETAHAMIFFNYMSERGEPVELQKIDAPPPDGLQRGPETRRVRDRVNSCPHGPGREKQGLRNHEIPGLVR